MTRIITLATALLGCVASGLLGCAASGASIDLPIETDAGSNQTCNVSQTACGEECVDLLANRSHCGSCFRSCGAAQFCIDGNCLASCPSGQTACGGQCARLLEDPLNCGACGRQCDEGLSCSGGTCTCGAGSLVCGSACTDILSDALNCGSCGTICGSDEECAGGVCACSGYATEVSCVDGRDNDCDGLIDCNDDDCVGALRVCTSGCGFGVQECRQTNEWSSCSARPSAESATECEDGIDQNCDGVDLACADEP
ncbi:MAG: hypothetical protein AAF355_04185 [Myxococcota bacterium]